MKKFTVAEIVLLILAITVGFAICSYFISILINPTNSTNIELRLKVMDLVYLIAGGVIGIAATLLSSKKEKNNETK